MRFPSIRDVRASLMAEWRYLRRTFKPADLIGPGEETASTDVRLQVYPDGSWALRTGLSDYDQDHRGFWGASSISWDRQDLSSLARDLIEQARDHKAQCEPMKGKP